MAKFRQVKVRFWEDEDMENLSPEARLVFLFLFTNEKTTESGIYRITFKTIADKTGLSREKIPEIINSELSKHISYDTETSIVFIHGFLKENNRGDSKLIIKSICSDVREFQSLPLWEKFLKIYNGLQVCVEVKGLIRGLQGVCKGYTRGPMNMTMTLKEEKKEVQEEGRRESVEVGAPAGWASEMSEAMRIANPEKRNAAIQEIDKKYGVAQDTS